MKIFFNGGGYHQLVNTLRIAGHQVVQGAAPWVQYIQSDSDWKTYSNVLLNQIKEHKPDVYICSKGFKWGRFICPETNIAIRKITKLNIYWSQDDPFFIPKFISLGMYRGYDIALSCSTEKFNVYIKAGIKPYLFWPAWDSEVRQECNINEKDKIDVIFVGTPYACTAIPRKDILLWIAKQGLSLEIYGSNTWISNNQVKKSDGTIFIQGDEKLKPYYKGMHTDWRSLPNLFSKARINISNHVNLARMYLNDRVFLVMGTGGFLMVDHNPGIEQVFAHNKELSFYEDWPTFKHRFNYYLKHVGVRKSIALNGQKKILTEHTYTNRAQQLLKIINENGVH